MSSLRPVLVMLLVVVAAASIVFALLGDLDWDELGMAFLFVVLFAPLKGITYRRLGARNPYLSALVGSVCWQSVGLAIDLDSFWVIMGLSFVVAFVIEMLALTAMGASSFVKRCLFLAFYGTLMVHTILFGFMAANRSLMLGLPFLTIGIVMFFLPAFYAHRFIQDAP